jgi:hypothetical protein
MSLQVYVLNKSENEGKFDISKIMVPNGIYHSMDPKYPDETIMLAPTNEYRILDMTKNGINGLDIGKPIPDKNYSIYAIGNYSNKKLGCCLASLHCEWYKGDKGLIILPDGYTDFIRIGWTVVPLWYKEENNE